MTFYGEKILEPEKQRVHGAWPNEDLWQYGSSSINIM